MKRIINDNTTQDMVLKVNIDSPNIYQVSSGKIINPVQEPMKRADQTDIVSSETIFQAYQKRTLVGKPKTTAEAKGRLSHPTFNFCIFN